VDARHELKRPLSQNLGPQDKVAEVLSQSLASLNDGETTFEVTQDE
jgi:hypothetical protein